MPKLWQVSCNRGYVIAVDFVKDRFDSPLLAALVVITGIVALIPYIALQIYGIEVSIGEMGIPAMPRSLSLLWSSSYSPR